MFLQSSVSGLQRLFSTATSSLSPHSQRGQRQLESVTEEAHTYDLLYPDGDTLLQGQHHAYPLRHGDPAFVAAAANSSDDRGGLDIQSPCDVRIVVAQDANTRSPQPRVLYDSHPSIPLSQARSGYSPEATPNVRQRADSFTGGLMGGGMKRNDSARKPNTAPHSRQSSLSQTAHSLLTSPNSPLSPVSELGGLFGNATRRNTSARPATSDGESLQGKIAREGREETETLLECMFGAATGFPSTSSTKLHVRPPKSTGTGNENRPLSASRESASSAAFPKRRTPLTRSTTAADLQTLSVDTAQQPLHHDSTAIWITRLFSVDLKDPHLATQSSEGSVSPEQHHPRLSNDSQQESTSPTSAKKEKAKQLKTPTYAIAILLQMPPHRQRPLTPSPHRSNGYSASSQQSWPFDGSSSFNMPGADSHGDIEYVIAHWSIIDRALSSLEVVARCKISDALGKLDVPNPAPVRDPIKSSDSGSSITVKKTKQPTQWTLQLPGGALQGCSLLHDTVDATGKRIALALKIRKVVVGQGRWGIWREEARWVDKWAGGREHNFFFFNLLTAFVGSHTEWLDSLAPSRYRRRQAKNPKKGHKETNTIQHRTVIVSLDKMAGRRLIFLFSAFLPGAYLNLQSERQAQSDLSWSNTAYSQSPPSGLPVVRQQSLRRTINRRPRGNHANTNPTFHGRSISFSDSEVTPSFDYTADGQISPRRSRRPSDARSVRSAALLITSDGSVTRKSSTTTTATIKPQSAVPVAHFASHPSNLSNNTTAGPRPGSSESLAPLSLQRTLSRPKSNDHGNASTDSQPGSAWGSFASRFWSGRRGSSTEDSDPLASSEEGLGISGIPRQARSQRLAPSLNQMVEEVENRKIQSSEQRNMNASKTSLVAGQSPIQGLQALNKTSEGASPPRTVPEKPAAEFFPLKLSIDENDGVVDVDLPPANSYPSSFASTASSSVAVHTAASSFNEHPSLYRRTSNPVPQCPNSESAGDVAGWLRHYHQDFSLQAVRPYDNLKEDIKRSMRTEPTPTPTSDEVNPNEWTDVCTTLIADTTNFTVTRLCLRRKNATSSHHRANALLESPICNTSFEEEITEEPLMDMDPIFIDAVEKVLSHSGESSRVASRAPSPSRQREREMTTPTGGSPGLEVPKSECKRLVLGALELVARSVSAEVAAGEQEGKDVGRGKRYDMPTESSLREGVRRWFREVDGIVA